MAQLYHRKWDEMRHQLWTRDSSMKMSIDMVVFNQQCEFAIHFASQTIFLGPLRDIISGEAGMRDMVIEIDPAGMRLPEVVPRAVAPEQPIPRSGPAQPAPQLAPHPAPQPAPQPPAPHHRAPLPPAPQRGMPQPQAVENDGSDDDRGPKDSDFVPRPRNGFLIFLTWRKTVKPGKQFQSLSQVVGPEWKALSEEQLKLWADLQEDEKQMHQALFPDFKHSNKKKPKLTKKQKDEGPQNPDLAARLNQFREYQQAHMCPPGFTHQMVDEAVDRKDREDADQQTAVQHSLQHPDLAPESNASGSGILPRGQPSSPQPPFGQDSQQSPAGPSQTSVYEPDAHEEFDLPLDRWHDPVSGSSDHYVSPYPQNVGSQHVSSRTIGSGYGSGNAAGSDQPGFHSSQDNVFGGQDDFSGYHDGAEVTHHDGGAHTANDGSHGAQNSSSVVQPQFGGVNDDYDDLYDN
ncbi:hypothetical protein F5Y16DRAFT_398820 [Xylariaceae sp. FL0255]|nr:hypothetical protein F5Y16DRAFT_398820 [Xylariaceae sp. FL0255]